LRRDAVMRGLLGKFSETFQARRSGRRAVGRLAMAAASQAAPCPAQGERALDPAQGLLACHMASWSWDLASDRLVWGPTAMAALGFDRRRHLSSGKAWASLAAPGSGESRADVIHGAAGVDHGEGAPFRCRYVVNAGRGLCVIEERGRWHAGPDGRPARAEGVMRVCPIDGRPPDAPLAGRRIEPARDIVTRTLTAMLHDPARGLRSVSAGVCLLTPRTSDVSASDPAMMDLAAAAIARRLRRTDVVAVLDPGQFALILNGCDSAQGRQAAAAVARNVERACPGLQAHVGLVTASDGAGDASSLLERASEAARQAAEAGEMVAVLAPRARRRPAARPAAMSMPDVIALLNGRDIVLGRRRLVDLDGADLRLEEALPVAACDGGAGVMGPGSLAPVAAQMNLSGLLDQRMLEQTVRLLAADPAAHMLLCIAPATLVSPEWRGAVAAWLAAHPGVSARLVIALDEKAFAPAESPPARHGTPKESAPETGPMEVGNSCHDDGEGQATGADAPGRGPGHDPRAIAQHLAMMKALGVSVGVTGFGLGWLKLEDLSAMAVDVVCMSGLFVNESLSLVGPDRFVVRALVDGVREIGAAVVAPAP